VVTVADSVALRSRRARLHRDGDHSLCRHGPQDENQATTALVDAVLAEWDDQDPLSKAMAVRLAQLAGGRGPAAVSALRGLAELAAFQRGPGGMIWPGSTTTRDRLAST
jgi:hypothetical protein